MAGADDHVGRGEVGRWAMATASSTRVTTLRLVRSPRSPLLSRGAFLCPSTSGSGPGGRECKEPRRPRLLHESENRAKRAPPRLRLRARSMAPRQRRPATRLRRRARSMATSSTTSTATSSAFFVYRPRCQPWQASCARIYFLPCSSAGATKASKNGLKCCSSSLVAWKSLGNGILA